MDQRSGHNRVMPVHSLRDYFRSSIDEVIAQQGVSLDPHAAHYVVNLLTTFSRSDELYQDDGECYGIRPLALMLADAADAESVNKRNLILRRIGDVALFISGFFAHSLAKKAVDIDYYICMGGSAYSSLSKEVRGTLRDKTFASIYRELSLKFQVLVDVLNELSEGAKGSEADLLRTYEIWLKTGSQRAGRILKENGVIPIAGANFQKH